MANLNGPLIVRRPPPVYFAKPGIHSHNVTRRIDRGGSRFTILRVLQIVLLLAGMCGLGYYGYTLADEYIYQAYQNWSFDQQIAGRRGVTFADYLRERTPFGFLVGSRANPAVPVAAPAPSPENPAVAPPPAEGTLLGRVEIPRLNLSAMVRQGVDAKTLSLAVGHVPSTALPGQPGNFAIAAHRDTLFRALKDIRKGDLVSFQSGSATYTYQVVATKIVKPSDVSVLRPDGGGLIPALANASSGNGNSGKLLTMITCYPFYYVGSAPNRFIVEAKQVSPNEPEKSIAANGINTPGLDKAPIASSAAPMPAPKEEHAPSGRRNGMTARSHKAASTRSARAQRASAKANKKHGFWHKLFHVS